MQEGTFSPNPVQGASIRQNSWELPSAENQSQGFAGQAPVVNPESVAPQKVNPVIYKSNNSSSGGGEKKSLKIPIKKILIILLGIFVSITIIIIIFSMKGSEKIAPTNNEVTLTYWGVFEDESVIKPVISEFEQNNPNIKIVYEKQDLSDYRQRLIARTENGKGPDVFRYHNTWYPSISSILLPLPNEVIKKEDFESKYYNVAKTDLIQNGAIYGIPLYTDTLSLYINTDILNASSSATNVKIPKTWVDFIETAKALTKRDERGGIEVAGAGIGVYENVKYAPDILSLLMVQNGVDLENFSGYKDKISVAIQFYTNFSQINDNVWDSTQDDSQLAFSQGKLAMFFGYSWDYFEIKAKNPNIKMIVVPVPQLVSNNPSNIASYWAEGVSSQTPNPSEAFLFMEFLSRTDTQEKLFEEAKKTRDFGEPYSVVGLSEKLKDTTPFVFTDQSRFAVSSPFVFVAGENNTNTELNNFLKDAVSEVISQGSDETAIDSLIGGYTQTVNQYLGN